MDYLCYGARVVISSFNLKNIMSEETNIPAVEEVVDAAAATRCGPASIMEPAEAQ
jgi:hypothetical protein